MMTDFFNSENDNTIIKNTVSKVQIPQEIESLLDLLHMTIPTSWPNGLRIKVCVLC